jgi:mxaL protein
LGFWRADEVMQTDLRSQGRGASVRGETLADDNAGSARPMLGATPGSEHLSALREGYLRLLAGEQGMAFLRLQPGQGLEVALTSPAMAKPVAVRTGARDVLAGLAFFLLLACYAAPWLRKTRVLKK